ncbi:nickel-dependent hydrogenase large subunit [Azospirillum sp. TSO35-2]|uniref:nickel-dependent hydrogenase large subunit n=1 Tax=Azospirillum sp. TSO35-2 TaxID=716796 RepID=UPI000D6166A3|nr:nickel-dependent hydrogenase large subunit [Azospirillum sp. TSO35-2]PWC34378.1 HupV protein [Azospirillum sp. TSO35-2]
MSDETKRRLIVGPFNRVEGDLEVRLEITGGTVSAAYVNAPLFRGFERILEGRDPLDALVVAPRICGICSVSQSHAAALALAGAMGLAAPRNGLLATNLMTATENVADHLTHFHLFFMPDFARPAYAGRPWFAQAEARFKAVQGVAVRAATAARAGLFHVLGLLGGKWPHTLTLQPGGVTRAVDARDRVRLLATVGAFRRFLEDSLFGAPLDRVLELATPEALDRWRNAGPMGDFRLFLEIAADLDLAHLGRAYGRFLSHGAYPDPDGGHLYRRGTAADGRAGAFDPAEVAEHHRFSRMAGQDRPHPPFAGSTVPDGLDETGYSWCKAPRLAGLPFETGAIARQLVDGHPLIGALVAQDGGSVYSRVIARLLELARTTRAMEGWLRALDPSGPWCVPAEMPDSAQAVGLTEAARGALGHWLRIEQGRIAGYQIIAPTTWNFSPRDLDGVPGPLEQALVGAPVRDGERAPLSVQHIVRSFDPCMVCTVH